MRKNKKKMQIVIHSLNQRLPNTCGGCKHTDNDLGVVSLHCDMYYEKGIYTKHISEDCNKVRSWYKACKYYEPIKK